MKDTTLPTFTKKIFDSDFVINYRLEKAGLRDTFNNAIAEIFKENYDLPEYDLKIYLTKTKEATVEMAGKSIMVVVPVGIQVEKKTFLTDLKAKGVLEMSFLTDVGLDSVWNLSTKTTLSHHRWIDKPKLNIAGVNFPIETISNSIIKRSKTDIEKSIDESVKESFTLKQKMLSTVKMMTEPMNFDAGMGGWLQLKPSGFRISEVENSRFTSRGKILIRGTSNFTTSKPEFKEVKDLPKVHWDNNIPDSSVFRLLTEIKMMDINKLLKENLDGKTFSSDGKSITLSNLVTNCDFEKIKVITDVSGSVNGMLIITGRPVYDPVLNSFYTKDIDISFKTKNVIHKAASWIAEGKIRKELSERLKFSIEDSIDEIQNNINAQITAFNKNYEMDLQVRIGSVTIETFELKPGVIEAVMKAGFYMEAKIFDFRTFNKF
ncbi:MAG: DUF4403 family protein [Saprospiraceae bacterium]|nr:DUF4403 family protein [Saprospiraceae bacterium]